MASEYPLYVYDLTRLEHTMIVHSLDEEKDAAEQGYTRIANHPLTPKSEPAPVPVRSADEKFPMWVYWPDGTRAGVVVNNQKELEEKVAEGYSENVKAFSKAVILDNEIADLKTRLAQKTKERREIKEESPAPLSIVENEPGKPLVQQVGRAVKSAYKCPTCGKSNDNLGQYQKCVASHRTKAQT
jgi:hypothetical protein